MSGPFGRNYLSLERFITSTVGSRDMRLSVQPEPISSALNRGQSETDGRQFWPQALAGSAALACHVAAQATDEKKEALNGRSVSELLKQAKESTTQAFEQWKILGERNAQDDHTRQSISTLRDTLTWCARLLNR